MADWGWGKWEERAGKTLLFLTPNVLHGFFFFFFRAGHCWAQLHTSPWDRKESDTAERLNWTGLNIVSGKNCAQTVELSKLKACLFRDPTWVSSRLFLIGLQYLFHPFGNVLALGRDASKAPSAWYWQYKSHKPELGYHSVYQWQWHGTKTSSTLDLFIRSVPGAPEGPESPEEDVCAYWAHAELPWRLWFTRILLGESYGSIYHERQTSSRFTIRFWTLSLKSIS